MSDPGGIAGEQLKSIVERIERLDEEIKGLNDGKSEIYQEAKSNGFDVKIVRQVIKLRKKDADERFEEETLLDLYMTALGMTGGVA